MPPLVLWLLGTAVLLAALVALLAVGGFQRPAMIGAAAAFAVLLLAGYFAVRRG